tara:strand:+ start:251 stop:1072 length:822 start_codon:yes stop_codon:yes gene_type:complete
MNIGIIGNGFVGEAMAFAFSPSVETKVYDLDPLKSTNSLEETLDSNFVFICLPTPMKKDGNQDLSFIIDFFKNNKINHKPIYIIKSTILPGTTKNLSNEYPNLKIVFSPEFLTERTAKLDILTQSRVIIGSDNKEHSNSVEKLFNKRFKNRNVIKTDSITAEFIKYMNNNFFATKVSLMNEYFRLSKVLDVDWDDALNGFVSDQRIGDSHLNVPGPDGKFGFGGSCFPKDINAMISFANKKNIKMNVLEAAWKTNLEVRPEEDWKELKGRAVS